MAPYYATVVWGGAWIDNSFSFFSIIPYEIWKFIFLECHTFAQQKFSGKYENFRFGLKSQILASFFRWMVCLHFFSEGLAHIFKNTFVILLNTSTPALHEISHCRSMRIRNVHENCCTVSELFILFAKIQNALHNFLMSLSKVRQLHKNFPSFYNFILMKFPFSENSD